MSSTQFVQMYHPLIPSTATTPAWVALQSVDDHTAHGWLLVDPEATLPDPVTPYYTTAAADSRFVQGTQLGTKTADLVTAGTGALPVALRAASGSVAATVAASGALVVQKHNPVDATGGVQTMTLPTGQVEGTQVSVEKVDSSVNTVAVTGHQRGVAAQTITLVWPHETITFRADAAGSWWPISGHKTKASLEAAFGRGLRPTGNLVAVIGTSLDTNAYTGQTTYVPNEAPSWINRVFQLSGGRMQKWGHFAVPGATTQQIHDLQLPQVLALSPRPHACIVGCGPNEAAAGPTAGWKTLVTDICNQLRAVGIVPILKLEPPRGAQGAGNIADASGTQQMNRWKQHYAAIQGLPVVDCYTPVVHITGGITTAYNADNVHLTEAGYLAVATDVATRQNLPSLFPPPGLTTVKDLQDSTDILAGAGLFNGSAPGWAVYGTAAALALAAGSGQEAIAGSWLKVTRAAATTGDSLIARFLDMTGKTPGDAITFAFRFKTTGFTALAGAASYLASLHWNTTGGDVYQSAIDTTTRDTTDGLVVVRTTVPPNATDLQLDFTVKGNTTSQVELYLAEVAMRNRTALGLA